jgi:protein-S-isoprenylcysteine O-methyltransferase Ste14
MTRSLAIRTAVLYAPVALAAIAWRWRSGSEVSDDRRRLTAALIVACGWNAVGLVVLQITANHFGWWHFAGSEMVLGMPPEAYVGWVVLWGVVPTLVAHRVRLRFIVITCIWLDMLTMPRMQPVLVLNSTWLVGELIAVCGVLIPSQLAARWTLASTHLAARSSLQALTFSGLLLLVVPLLVFDHVGGTWAPLVERTARWNHALAQIIAIPAIFGLSAVQEFAVRGRGTPLPYDPPVRLVTSGPYAYVANPMQLAVVFVFAGLAVMLESAWMLAGSAITVVYSVGLAAWHEDREISVRYGLSWARYRAAVAKWVPRWRPVTGHASPPAVVYVAASCELCSGVALWLSRHSPAGLLLRAAEDHPTRQLTRMRYEDGDGYLADGVEAFARCLEHINLAYAWMGMLMRLPMVCAVLQLIVDATGGGPRRLQRGPSNDDSGAITLPEDCQSSMCDAVPR